MNRTLLVTGAAGFVGLNVVQRALVDGRTVVGLSGAPVADAVAAHFAALPGRFVEIVGDIRDRPLLDALLREHRVGRVLHMAAITAASEREKVAGDEIVSVNLAGTATVIGAAAAAGVERLVVTGSIAVYGGLPPDASLIDEDVAHAPQTLYAITKSAGEAITARLATLHGLDWIVARLGRVFGPFEHDSGVRDTLSQIHQVTTGARAGRAVAFERPCLKNWSYAPDVADQLATLLDAAVHRESIYNLGTEHAFTLADWCALLRQRYPKFRFDVGGDPAPDATPIDLGGARDGGLLSWQRFAAEFHPAPSTDLATAFGATMQALDLSEARRP